MSNFKKIMHFISTVVVYSIMLLLLIVVLMFGAYFIDKKINQNKNINKGPLFGAYVIISESMVPRINVYDAVVTFRVNPNTLKKDDIITFLSKEIETAGTPITHRIRGIVYKDKSKKEILGFRTKGDHNNTEDFALIAPDEVIGKVMITIPFIGYLQTIMTNPVGWIIIVVIPCLLIIGGDVLKLLKSSGEEDDKNNNTKDKETKDIKLDNKTNKVENSKPKKSSKLDLLDDVFDLDDEDEN